MRGGNTTTRESLLGLEWRPLLASLCLHFAVAIGIGVMLASDTQPPRESISLAQVTLQSPTTIAPFFDGDEKTPSEPRSAGPREKIAMQDEAPNTAASATLAALSSTAIEAGSAPISIAPGASLNQTPSGRDLLIGSEGNTAADERLMQKDIERYLASQPPSGPPTDVALFGGKLTGHSFVFVIDRSASTSSKHYAVCAEIERQCALAIENLPPENRFGLVLYNDRISVGNGLKLATKKEKEDAKERMIRYSPYGGTMHLDALRAALLQRANVVCWFSDGGDPYLSSAEVEQLALLAARSKSVVHAWRLGKRPDDLAKDFMRQLAQRTGGEFHEGVPFTP